MFVPAVLRLEKEGKLKRTELVHVAVAETSVIVRSGLVAVAEAHVLIL